MDTIKQNRITRKKLRKAIKRQAARRRELNERLSAVSKANNDCEQLLHLAIKDVLECVNIGEFPQLSYVDFDLGFMKMSYVNGKFVLRSVSLPNKDHFK